MDEADGVGPQARGEAVRVLMDAERMNAYAVTPQDIAGALKVSNAL